MRAVAPSARAAGEPVPSHYDRFPYDVGVDAGAYLDADDALGQFLRTLDSGTVVDIGCGPGNLLPVIAARAGRAIGLELSAASAHLAASRTMGTADIVRADARHLPIRSGSVHHALATGSLHHTGDARMGFEEMARVLRPGGRAFVAVYGRGSYYELLYRTVGRAARQARQSPVADAIVNRGPLLVLFALYFVVGRAVRHRSLRRLSLRHIRNYYADQLLNPVVSFHTIEELSAWSAESGLQVVTTASSHAGALLQVVVGKPAQPQSTPDGPRSSASPTNGSV